MRGCQGQSQEGRRRDAAAACRTSKEEKLSDILRRTVNPDVRGPVGLNHRMEDESEITLTDREK